MTIDEAITTEIEYSQPCDIICKDGADCNDCRSYHRQLVEWLEELKQYRAISTVEECRAAVEQEAKRVIEKHKAKAPEDIEVYGEDAVFGYCPVCGGLQNTVWNTKYCGDCGQRLDWSDEE